MAKVFKDCPQNELNQSNIEFDSDAIVHGDSQKLNEYFIGFDYASPPLEES